MVTVVTEMVVEHAQCHSILYIAMHLAVFGSPIELNGSVLDTPILVTSCGPSGQTPTDYTFITYSVDRGYIVIMGKTLLMLPVLYYYGVEQEELIVFSPVKNIAVLKITILASKCFW